MDLIHTNIKRADVGVLKNYTLDLAFGADENNFELTIDLNNHCCEVGGFIYAEGTEYGGIIDGLFIDTANEKLSYTGRTWQGILASKIIEPGENEAYLVVSGDINRIIDNLLSRLGLDGLFVASTEESGLVIEGYKLDRYVDAYTGITKMLDSVSGKLKFSAMGNIVNISAEPIVDYSKDEQFDNNSVEMQIEKTKNAVNHLICLGKGELAERTVIHLFMDADGNISQKQTFFGLEEVTAVYDYPNVESTEELVKKGTEKFKEFASADKVNMNFTVDEATFDIGDIIGAKEIITNTVATAKITKKIVTISEGEVNIQYKVGE